MYCKLSIIELSRIHLPYLTINAILIHVT